MKVVQRILICLSLVISGTALATTRKIPLGSEIVGLGRVIQLYQEHHGNYPRSWNELERFSPGLDAAFPELNPTKRMALVVPPIALPKRYTGTGMAVAISRDAFRPLGWEDRPIIGGVYETLKDPSYAVAVISETGGISLQRLSPTTAKSLFDKGGSALPTPSGLGPFNYEKRVMQMRAFTWIAVVAITSWILWLLIRRFKNRMNKSPDESGAP